MWYYAAGGERKGPVGEGELVDLAQRGVVNGSTLVWTAGMTGWLPLAQTQLGRDPRLADVVSVPAPVAYVEGVTAQTDDWAARPDVLPDYGPEAIDRAYVWTILCFVLWVPSLIGCVMALGQDAVAAGIVLVVWTLGAFAAWVTFYCKLLHRTWEQVQGPVARITPGYAAGLIWIPLFTYYWSFVVVHGLALELNRVMSARGIPAPRPSPALALGYCIVNVAYVVGGPLALIPALVLWMIVFAQLKNASKAILLHRIGHARAKAGTTPSARASSASA